MKPTYYQVRLSGRCLPASGCWLAAAPSLGHSASGRCLPASGCGSGRTPIAFSSASARVAVCYKLRFCPRSLQQSSAFCRFSNRNTERTACLCKTTRQETQFCTNGKCREGCLAVIRKFLGKRANACPLNVYFDIFLGNCDRERGLATARGGGYRLLQMTGLCKAGALPRTAECSKRPIPVKRGAAENGGLQ